MKKIFKFQKGNLVKYRGDLYNIHPSAIGAKSLEVIIPEIIVKSPQGYRDTSYRKLEQMLNHTETPQRGVPLKSVYPEFNVLFLLNGFKPIKNPILTNNAKIGDLLKSDLKYLLTEDIIKGRNQGFKDVYEYYRSQKYIDHLKQTGLSEKEALELQDLKLNNLIETKFNFDISDPSLYGHNEVSTDGISRTLINPQRANTEDLVRETIWHETGGHATSKNYSTDKYKELLANHPELKNIYSNPWYRRISEHNSKLIPELKPQWKAFMEGDINTFKKLASKEDLEVINKYKDPKTFIEYLKSEQEATARAISANIGDFVGKETQWNLPQLERFFTPEGIKKLRDNVWATGSAFSGVVLGEYDYDPEK